MTANPYARQWAQFTGATASHELTVLHSDGLYRHLRMSAPGTGIWHWDVVTWPGHLAIDGDIGLGLIFSRDPDMIDFFAAGLRYATYDDGAPQIGIGYWAEKLARGAESVKNYSPDRFMAHVRTALDEGMARPSERAELLSSAKRASDSEHDAREWLQEERRAVGDDAYWEWDLKDWDHHFILACYAIAATVTAVHAEGSAVMIPDPCPHCGHLTHDTRAVGRFQATGPTGYRANYLGAPLRRTRAGAEEDQCAWQAARAPLDGQEPLL